MKHTEYFLNGKVKEEGEVKEGIKHGIWIEYYPNEKPKVKKFYEHGKKHGIFEYFKESGELDFKVNYIMGKIKVSNFKISKIIKL